MKKSKHNKWADHYTLKAKREHFPARSVYKLKEIQKKYKIIKKGDCVLDLGCSPGSWLLYAADLAGKKGEVVGIDLKPLSNEISMKLPSNARMYVGDVLSISDDFSGLIRENYNVVISDMAPATTGNKTVDAARSFELCKTALEIAQNVLKPGGAFICKIFQGEDFKNFLDLVKTGFNKQKSFKPESSRKSSKEMYIIGFKKK
ncbi:MAG: RlmE family RNA methyltransferase [Deltaproteobacteria bacterium]|nr:RlmE family RNA methyltransferase [Deltaproteobacteria bacterium]